MTPEPLCLTSQTLVSEARLKMENLDIRHAPVIDKGKLTGMLSQRDVLRAQSVRLDLMIPVHIVMSKHLRTISPKSPAGEAAAIMLRHKIGALPVVRGDLLVGIITETDFVRAAHQVIDLWADARLRS